MFGISIKKLTNIINTFEKKGTEKEEPLRDALKEFYEEAIDGAFSAVNQTIAYYKQAYETATAQAQEQFSSATKDHNRRIKDLEEQVTQLSEKLTAQAENLGRLNDSQQRAGIVSQAIHPPKEGITFDELRGLATEVADKAYEKIRDYFLLEMAKKGYADEKPDFEIGERDSGISIQFQALNDNFPRSSDDNRIIFNNSTRTKYRYRINIEDLSEFKRNMLYKRERNAREPQKYILVNDVKYSTEPYCIFGLFWTGTRWHDQLDEELPQLMQAYMLGYSLRCLEKGNHNGALQVQEKHGLKDNPALLARMATIMQQDPNLANAFATQYGRLEQAREQPEQSQPAK